MIDNSQEAQPGLLADNIARLLPVGPCQCDMFVVVTGHCCRPNQTGEPTMQPLFKSVLILAAFMQAAPAFAQGIEDRRERREERRDLIVPSQCIEEFDTRAGAKSLYLADCLRRSHIENRELPQDCLEVFRAEGERVRAYDPACLEDAGYRLVGQ